MVHLVEAERLRELVQAFVRSFGLLVTRQTPCGHPVSPSHAHALMVLLAREGQLTTQLELGKALGIDKSNVARLSQRMLEDGHAEQHPLPEDARARVVELTARGRRMAQQLESSSLLRFRRVLQAVPVGKRSQLLESLELLNAAVASLGEEPS